MSIIRIWPFLQAVRETDLSAYDLGVKLHTKRDFEIGREHRYNWCRYDGARWRNFLLSFCRPPGRAASASPPADLCAVA